MYQKQDFHLINLIYRVITPKIMLLKTKKCHQFWSQYRNLKLFHFLDVFILHSF